MGELIQGINILSQSDVRECSLAGVIAVIGMFLFLLFLFFIMCIEGGWKGITIIMLFFSIAVIIFGCAVYFTLEDYNTFHTEYKVTIDDSVSLKEFTNKYEILNQDGQIFTIEEKE